MPNPSEASALAGAVLTVDLGAIVANWRDLAAKAAGAECAAVVKADAYGLGADRVAPALAAAGCRTFFVAHPDEGIRLRAALGPKPAIAVLHGQMPGTEATFAAHDLLPVLSAAWQVRGWADFAKASGGRPPAIVQLDSGMTRFGMSDADLAALADDIAAFDLRLVMSHLACADEPDHPANAEQRDRFAAARARFPGVKASLAASSGIFLGSDFHADLVRPGAALYGVAPRADIPNPMRPVVRLAARILQLRDVPAGTPVGYGWTQSTDGPSRLATLAVGYADGFLRSLSGRAAAFHEGTRLPLVGRVSMDSIVVDVTALGDAVQPGGTLDLLGPSQGVDALASAAGTIGYEILTALGGRYHRIYKEA
jgi:alanine racemase